MITEHEHLGSFASCKTQSWTIQQVHISWWKIQGGFSVRELYRLSFFRSITWPNWILQMWGITPCSWLSLRTSRCLENAFLLNATQSSGHWSVCGLVKLPEGICRQTTKSTLPGWAQENDLRAHQTQTHCLTFRTTSSFFPARLTFAPRDKTCTTRNKWF